MLLVSGCRCELILRVMQSTFCLLHGVHAFHLRSKTQLLQVAEPSTRQVFFPAGVIQLSASVIWTSVSSMHWCAAASLNQTATGRHALTDISPNSCLTSVALPSASTACWTSVYPASLTSLSVLLTSRMNYRCLQNRVSCLLHLSPGLAGNWIALTPSQLSSTGTHTKITHTDSLTHSLTTYMYM